MVAEAYFLSLGFTFLGAVHLRNEHARRRGHIPQEAFIGISLCRRFSTPRSWR